MNKCDNNYTYEEMRNYVKGLAGRGIVPGLAAERELCACLGNPQDKIPTIHIAGTNGKGSVGSFIAAILCEAGCKVGHFLSPAVANERETININGSCISKSDYVEIFSETKAAADKLAAKGIYPTSFETETAAAFLYFYKNKCDWAIIECGMGGALDATNVIAKPEAAVITSIGEDHKVFLGDTIEDIAVQKAGIIKEGTKVFSANQSENVKKVLQREAAAKHSEITFADTPEIISADLYGNCFNYRGMKGLNISLAGVYQPHNAAIAADLCAALGIGETDIRNGLKKARRDFVFQADTDGWIYDGAHNPAAAKMLLKSIKALVKGKKLAYIIGVFKDKDYREILRITASSADTIFTVTPLSNRGLNSSLLAKEAEKYCDRVISADDFSSAVKYCAKGEFDNVIVFGSLSILSKIKQEKRIIYEQMQKNH